MLRVLPSLPFVLAVCFAAGPLTNDGELGWVGVKIFDRESPQSGNIGGVFTTLDFYHNLTEAAWCGAMDGPQLWDKDS